MVMPLFKLQTNPIMEMRESSVFLNICEKVLGALYIAMMMFIVHNDAKFFSIIADKEQLFFCIAAALPPLLYLFIGLWRKNIPLAVTACVFLIVRFVRVSGNLKSE